LLGDGFDRVFVVGELGRIGVIGALLAGRGRPLRAPS
jgi:hypothetical protein